MTKKLFLLSSSILLVALTSRGELTNRLHFPTTGFSIAPLEAPASLSPRQVLMMFLPEANSFAANVNVQVQPYGGSIDEYMTLSVQQCKTAGLKVLHRKTTGKTAAVLEYTGEMQGRPVHWYARAEKSGSKVYLVTATAAEEQWSKQAAQLKACVDSFRCDGGENAATPNEAPPRR